MEECFPRRPSSFQAQMGRGTEAAVTSRLQNPASGGNDDIDLERDQFRHEFGEESRIVSSRSEFEPMFPPPPRSQPSASLVAALLGRTRHQLSPTKVRLRDEPWFAGRRRERGKPC